MKLILLEDKLKNSKTDLYVRMSRFCVIQIQEVFGIIFMYILVKFKIQMQAVYVVLILFKTFENYRQIRHFLSLIDCTRNNRLKLRGVRGMKAIEIQQFTRLENKFGKCLLKYTHEYLTICQQVVPATNCIASMKTSCEILLF